MTLVLDDLDAALEDGRHNGWGYLTSRHLRVRQAAALDIAVIDVANELGLNYEDLFSWTNSKNGRWLVDGIESDTKPTAKLVREYLNEETMQRLREEEGR